MNRDDSHEMLGLIFSEKKKKKIKMLSAAVVISTLMVKSITVNVQHFICSCEHRYFANL